MNLLLDTHLLLWAASDPQRLPAEAAALLEDPLLELATAEIIAGDRPRAQVQRDIKQKERAREALSKKYRWGVQCLVWGC